MRYSRQIGSGTTKERVDELLKKAEEGIERCRSSEGFQTYLKAQAKLHRYSYNNTLLIAAQLPEATYVAGYRTWSSLGTAENPVHVRTGEKGIMILSPAPYKKQVTDADGKPVIDEETGEVKTVTVSAYKPAFVFDISQVEGATPEMFSPCKLLEGEVPNFEELKVAIEASSTAPIKYMNIKGGANGYYSPSENQVVIKKNMPEVQTIKTLIHEIAHAKLHMKATPEQEALFKRIGAEDLDKVAASEGYGSYRAFYDAGKRLEGLEDVSPEIWEQYESYGISRAMMETQAESTAYVVCEHYGLDSGSEYSFPYIATWADADLTELKESMRVIQRTSCSLIEDIDRQLELNKLASAEDIAYKINGYGYLYMQRSGTEAGGYDYTIYNTKFRAIDGGHFDDQLVPMDEAARSVLVSERAIEVYRLHEVDTIKFLTQLEGRAEEVKQLAIDIAKETGLLTDQMEEVDRDAVVMRVSADLDRLNPECLDQLEELAKTSESAKELLERATKIADVSKFTASHLSA